MVYRDGREADEASSPSTEAMPGRRKGEGMMDDHPTQGGDEVKDRGKTQKHTSRRTPERPEGSGQDEGTDGSGSLSQRSRVCRDGTRGTGG